MPPTSGAAIRTRWSSATTTSPKADIVVADMLFLDEHVRAVMPALLARRDACDAMVCCLSAGEIVKLTRVGRFDMSKEAGGALAWLKRLRGKSGSGTSGQGQMKR